MALALQSEFNIFNDRKLTSKNVMLTSRDLEIIEFITEMKFSSLEGVFQKFFKITQNDGEAKSMLWAKKRLLQLEQAKFIRIIKAGSDKTTFYTATLKAYYALSNLCPEKVLCKPVGGFDYRTYAHDHNVLICRLILEEALQITDWVSDRKLKSIPELSGGFSAEQVPDGIYTTTKNEKIAFELEISRKAKARYAEKIKHYVNYLRAQKKENRKFDRIHFVCFQEPVKELLVKETKIYGQLFTIESKQEFETKLLRGNHV